jgi:hypothetical protein
MVSSMDAWASKNYKLKLKRKLSANKMLATYSFFRQQKGIVSMLVVFSQKGRRISGEYYAKLL